MNITIISGTNRENSFTNKISVYYKSQLEEKGYKVQLFSLTNLPHTFAFSELYGKRSSEFEEAIKKYIETADAFIFVTPEYNGSLPGIVKLFIDSVPPSKWNDKSVCLTGVSIGRAGNIRGMEHLGSILQYLKMHVYHNKLPISQIDKIYAGQNNLVHEETVKNIEKQLEGFLKFA